MTNVAAAAVVAVFFLAAIPAVALPLVVLAASLVRFAGLSTAHALGAVAGGVLLVGLVAGALLGFDADTAAVPLALGLAYVAVPLAVGTVVARALTRRSWDGALRVTTGAWVPALVLAVVSWTVLPMATVLAAVPGPAGVALAAGYVAYLAAVGVLAGALGAAYLGYRARGGDDAPRPRST